MKNKRTKKINIFVGDNSYTMNPILQFSNQITYMRYLREHLIKHKYQLTSSIVLSMLFNIVVYKNTLAQTIMLFILHTIAYFINKRQHSAHNNTALLRIVLMAITICNKINLINIYGHNPYIFFNFWSNYISTILAIPWYTHLVIELTEGSVIGLLFRYKIIASCIGFGHLLYCTAISVLICGYFERMSKESWVYYDTYKNSYLTFQSIVEQLPHIVIITNKQGNILYSNPAAKNKIVLNSANTSPTNARAKRSTTPKLINSIHESNRSMFSQYFDDVVKSKAAKNLRAKLLFNSNKCEHQYEECEVSISQCKWKKLSSVLIVIESMESYYKKLRNYIQSIEDQYQHFSKIAFEIEGMYEEDKRKYRKVKPIIEKVARMISSLQIGQWYISSSITSPTQINNAYDIISVITYSIDTVASIGFEKGNSIELAIESTFPVDVVGDYNIVKNAVIGMLQLIFMYNEKETIQVKGVAESIETEGCKLKIICVTKHNYDEFRNIIVNKPLEIAKLGFSLCFLFTYLEDNGGSLSVEGNENEAMIIFTFTTKICVDCKSIVMNKLDLAANCATNNYNIIWQQSLAVKQTDCDPITPSSVMHEISSLRQKSALTNLNENAKYKKLLCNEINSQEQHIMRK